MKNASFIFIFVFFLVPQSYSQIFLEAPQELQVFQRAENNEALVTFKGHVSVSLTDIILEVKGQDYKNQYFKCVYSIPIEKNGNFSLTIRLPAGGWYDLYIHDLNYEYEKEFKNWFGVGEIFIVSGQSNSTNFGEGKTESKTKRVSVFTGKKWVPAKDPIVGVADDSKGSSFLPTFGDRIVEEFNVPVGLSGTGYGGMGVVQWIPPHVDENYLIQNLKKNDCKSTKIAWLTKSKQHPLFSILVDRMKYFGPYGFRALLWEQGETDTLSYSKTCLSTYYYDAIEIIKKEAIKAVGWDFPWIMAFATYLSDDFFKGGYLFLSRPIKYLRYHPDDILNAQHELMQRGIVLRGPDANKLQGEMRGKDTIHMSQEGIIELGNMWADSVITWLKSFKSEKNQESFHCEELSNFPTKI